MPDILLAYLDPGAGSLLLQILLGGWAAAFVLVKLGWKRIRSIFVRDEPTDQPETL